MKQNNLTMPRPLWYLNLLMLSAVMSGSLIMANLMVYVNLAKIWQSPNTFSASIWLIHSLPAVLFGLGATIAATTLIFMLKHGKIR